MAPNKNERERMSDEEIEALRAEMEAQQDEIREYLASEGVDTSAWDDGEGATEARADGGE
jgi:DNA-binding transcriptional regulator YiaG